TNTQPKGSFLPALNPITTTLGVTNASFVAQTADWVPAHLLATIRAAYRHPGFSFVRILQRCPKFTAPLFAEQARTPDLHQMLVHPDGVTVPGLDKIYKRSLEHDPADIHRARSLAEDQELVHLGVFYRNDSRGARPLCRLTPAYSRRSTH
ncbi:MAG: hypothetical protein JRH16_23565, partial [Deltaproteobacteria bacterium]|nr:hypothetical protein [Deltaproteobacteria bacterium]